MVSLRLAMAGNCYVYLQWRGIVTCIFNWYLAIFLMHLCDDARHCDAIVEENFPPGAMTDDHIFYASEGDEGVL